MPAQSLHLFSSVLCCCYLSFLLAGCGTLLGNESSTFEVDSEPPGATVKGPKGKVLGQTPLRITLPAKASSGSSESIMVSLPGYRTARIRVKPDFNKRSLLNVTFTTSLSTFGAPSFTTDSLSGKLYRYQEGSYVVEMRKKEPLPPPSKNVPVSRQKPASEPIPKPALKPTKEDPKIDPAELERQQQEAERERAHELQRLENERLQLEQEIEHRQALEREQDKERQQQVLKSREETALKELEQRQKQETLRKQNEEQMSPRSKEDLLIEEMKKRYKNRIKRDEQRPRYPRGIEITPLSLYEDSLELDSPSYGALGLSIAHYRIIQEELARGGGPSVAELYLRLCLSTDHTLDPELVARAYPRFVSVTRQRNSVFLAPHGLALYRSIKPIQRAVISTWSPTPSE